MQNINTFYQHPLKIKILCIYYILVGFKIYIVNHIKPIDNLE